MLKIRCQIYLVRQYENKIVFKMMPIHSSIHLIWTVLSSIITYIVHCAEAEYCTHYVGGLTRLELMAELLQHLTCGVHRMVRALPILKPIHPTGQIFLNPFQLAEMLP